MLKITNLEKSYGDKRVLKDINLTFQEDKPIVIVGPSGSGKSTLLRCLNLLEIPDAGNIQLNEHTIDFSHTETVHDRDLLEIRRRTSMVFQEYNLFTHLTALENVIEGPVQVLKKPKNDAIAQAQELLDKVGLQDKYDAYPNHLSGGQKQRVGIARALAMNADYILLDEPTSSLDPEIEVQILNILKELERNEDLSMILVTHNLEFAKKFAERLIFIEEGEVYYDGATESFFTSDHPRIQRFIQSLVL